MNFTLVIVVCFVGFVIVTLVRMFLDQPRCNHQWDVRVTVVAAPVKMDLIPGGRMSRKSVEVMVSAIERLNTGYTSVLLTCDKCGAVDGRAFDGVPETPEEQASGIDQENA